MRGVTALTAVAVLMLSGACGTTPPPTSQEHTVPTQPTPTPATPDSDLVAQAKADLATRLGIDVAQVTVVSSTAVTWPDGSLGCPKPGMFYTQALVDGTRTILEAGGTRYNYHSGGGRAPFLCTS